MFDPTSRYYGLPTATCQTGGRSILYKTRRFVPQGAGLSLLAELAVRDHDRMDLIAYRTLGDPLQFWRVCDANDALDPSRLTEEPGRTLRIPIPQA